MTAQHFKEKYQKLILFMVICMLPIVAHSATDDVVNEKRKGVAMRMIGHEVLMCLGDFDSRVMPIEKIEDQNKTDTYRIPFEFEFGFDPDDIVSIVHRVMTESGIATDYLVEVEQCETKDVVHSFEIRSPTSSDLIPCKGRVLPEDCYSLLISILEGQVDAAEYDQMADSTQITSLITDASLISLATKKSSPFKSALLIVPMIFLIGFIGYFIQQKNLLNVDPNLVFIGASQFDRKNMVLSFENISTELSHKEAELLSLLHASANAPLEREVILQKVWGDEGDYVGRTLDVFISKLRKKLEADISVKIVNIRGVGYKLIVA